MLSQNRDDRFYCWRYAVRVAWIVERGLQELLSEQSGNFLDEKEIIGLLASQPTPEQILAIRPSPEFQARVSDLLAQSKAGTVRTYVIDH
jgi:hypothetical protein